MPVTPAKPQRAWVGDSRFCDAPPENSIFATTALVATAGVASADVALSGSADMGVSGGGAGINESFHTDIDVTFTMSGETDNGLTFGASIDLDESIGDSNNQGTALESQATRNDDAQGGETVFISGDFGTVTMGDTDSAFDWAITEAVGNPGSIGDEETGHEGYVGGNYLDGSYDGQILRYDNTFGDFGVAISVQADDTGANDASFALGFRYGLDFGGGSANFGLAYHTSDAGGTAGGAFAAGVVAAGTTIDIIGLSANVALDSGFTAGVSYASIDAAGQPDVDHYMISAGYSFDAISIGANYGEFNGGTNNSGYGIAASYDLGGGATVHLGYGNSDNANRDAWSFGVAMSF